MPSLFNNQLSGFGGQGSGIRLVDFLAFAVAQLKTVAIDNPQQDARILTAHGLKLDRAQLLSQSERILTAEEINLLTIFITCRAKHESVARIIGMREFWSLPFGLNEATLEPRPDSETVIEAALLTVKQRHAREGARPISVKPRETHGTPACAGVTPEASDTLQILDIGTGTGCLLLALLHELPQATGLGIDIAPRAVEQAQKNADALGLSERAAFQTHNWVDGIRETFDVIISNPPYIPQNVIPTLAPEVREFDPKLALDGGADGLDAYRIIIPQLPRLMKPNGLVVLEIGYDQAEAVAALLQQTGFAPSDLHKDLGGNPRCLTARIDETC